MPAVDIILTEVLAERERQDALLRAGRLPYNVTSFHVSHFARLGILTEEVGEAAKVLNDCCGDPTKTLGNIEHLRTELIQVAAVAVGWIEFLDYERKRGAR